LKRKEVYYRHKDHKEIMHEPEEVLEEIEIYQEIVIFKSILNKDKIEIIHQFCITLRNIKE
jgi:hypothetical protein